MESIVYNKFSIYNKVEDGFNVWRFRGKGEGGNCQGLGKTKRGKRSVMQNTPQNQYFRAIKHLYIMLAYLNSQN